MSDPFRSELEAAHARIQQMETDHAAELAKLRAENDRLRKRLVDSVPERNKTGKTFFAIAMLTLAISLVVGALIARIAHAPSAPPPAAHRLDPAAHADLDFDRPAAERAVDAVSVEGCGAHGPGKAKVTFSSTGYVSLASVDAPLRETPAGECLEARFRAVRVTPFGGPPRVVERSFVMP